MQYTNESLQLKSQIMELRNQLSQKNAEIAVLKPQPFDQQRSNITSQYQQDQYVHQSDLQHYQPALQKSGYAQSQIGDEKDQIIQELNQQLTLANEEILAIHDEKLETAKTQMILKEEGKDIDQVLQDIEIMRETMAADEAVKAEDKAQIIFLKEENEKLLEKIEFLENQFLQLKKCFGGLKSVCEGAEDRIDQLLAVESVGLDLTVGQGKIVWK